MSAVEQGLQPAADWRDNELQRLKSGRSTDLIGMSTRSEASVMFKRLAVHMALPFGLFLAIAEVVRNWGDWGFWAFWVVDYIAVALLLAGWYASVRAQPGAASVLAGAWGFNCAMFYMSFFGHLETIELPDHGPIEQRALTLIIGVLFAVTIVGFGSAMMAGRAEGAGRTSAVPDSRRQEA